jgi:hypothetical protein
MTPHRLTCLLWLFCMPIQAADEGLDMWQRVYAVFSHPRCANCHVPDDRPRWSGPSYGETQLHGMFIHGGADRIGATTLICNTCHMAQNSDLEHGPPGVPVWLLAPLSMVWWERGSAEICAQIKDPERNGGRTLEQIAEHVRHDELVGWGWHPGPGREPAPYSAEQTADDILRWHAAGAPCPASD